jgi:hypothetical protein
MKNIWWLSVHKVVTNRVAYRRVVARSGWWGIDPPYRRLEHRLGGARRGTTGLGTTFHESGTPMHTPRTKGSPVRRLPVSAI